MVCCVCQSQVDRCRESTLSSFKLGSFEPPTRVESPETFLMQLLLRCENPSGVVAAKWRKNLNHLETAIEETWERRWWWCFLGIHSSRASILFLRKMYRLILQWLNRLQPSQCKFVICVTIHMTHDIVFFNRESSSPYASFIEDLKTFTIKFEPYM